MTNAAILPALGTEPETPVPTQGRGSGFSLPGPTPAETEQPSEYCGDDGWRRGIFSFVIQTNRRVGETDGRAPTRKVSDILVLVHARSESVEGNNGPIHF